MTNIHFTNIDNFTVNDDDQLTTLTAALESQMKREALLITYRNAKELLSGSLKATAAFCDYVTHPK